MDEIFARNAIETKFTRLTSQLGREMALFALCAVLDVPYAEKTDAETWEDYLATIQDAGMDVIAGFGSGITDASTALNAELSDMERWREVWGVGNINDPYTEDDYKRLDHLFRTYSARLAASGGYDEQQEFILRSVCTDQILADQCRNKGTKDGIEMYTKLTKTIQEKLGAENLRKKDILPQQEQRIDGFVDALKKKYGVDASLTKDQAIALCCQWLRSHNYPETADAAENAILAIINCTRRNNDMQEIDKLPRQYKFDPAYNSEFADDPNDMEDEAYRYLDLRRQDGRG